ncbi:Tensin phosphatase, lipid phosphatase domain [Phytophthora cactorum]|nr:Tensin phosphatase, lipid phosphatase domain [Phytophthora cactorum]
MFKKLSERFPAAATRLEAYTGVGSHESKTTSPSSDADTAGSPSPAQESDASAAPSPPPPTLFGEESVPKSDDHQSATLKATLTERFNSESMSAAASTMMGFMQKAKVVAASAAKEGALRAGPLDGEVNLELLNFSYVTENLVAMGFPNMNLGTNRTLLKDNPIDLVAMYLNDKHGGHYMIWNLSEETYDYTYFDNQVLEFNFPGHPAPPLGLVFKICSSIESWLQADEKNLAAVHCLTGKGRTGTVIACYLAWVGQFPNAMESLEYVAEQRQTSVEKLTIPSQRRYIQYFNNVMDGVKPRSSPLLLRRVIINTIPVFGERRMLEPAKKGSSTMTDRRRRHFDPLSPPDGCWRTRLDVPWRIPHGYIPQGILSISGTDEDTVGAEKVNRKGSWNEEKDKQLMSELESLTSGALAKAAEDVGEEKALDVAVSASGTVDSTDLSKEFDEMKNLEKELGLQSFSSDLASLPDGKIDPQLELLDAELKGLEGLSPKAGDDTDDVMNFGADDFEELEEYLSGLSTK